MVDCVTVSLPTELGSAAQAVVGRCVQHQRIWLGCDQIKCVFVDHFHIGEQAEDTLEVGAFFQAVKGPLNVSRGQFVAGVELDAIPQMKAGCGYVDLFPTLIQD